MSEHPSARVQALLRLLFLQSEEGTYAVLDAARSANLYDWIGRCGLQAQSLYSGTAAVTLAEQAPYLVRLRADSPPLAHLLEAGWGQSLGVFVLGSPRFEDVRIQLKKKLVTRNADGRRHYFRFYDPRVARAFLATADAPGLRWWFDGGITRWLLESADGDALLVQRQGSASTQLAVHRQHVPPPMREPLAP
jgi:hypothetical protein